MKKLLLLLSFAIFACAANAQLLIANAGSDQTICFGQSTTLDGTPTATGGTQPYTYLWSTGSITDSTIVTPLTTSIYTVTVTDGLGASATDDVIVTVNPLPTADAGVDQTICAGQSATLTATGGVTYIWSNGYSTASIVVSPVDTTLYTVSVTNLGCTAIDYVTVNVNTTAANAGIDQTICQGQSATLAATGGVTYLWSNGYTTATIIVSPTVTTSYNVTVANIMGCTATDDVIVNVSPPIIANAGPNQCICVGQSATLTATGGGTYQWSGGPSTANYTVSPVTTTTYTVTITSLGCSASDDVTVFINNNIANAGFDQTICFGSCAILTGTGGINYIWNTGQITQSITVCPTTTTTYTLTVADINGCTASDDMIIFVDPPLNVSLQNINSSCSTCNDGSATLSVTGGTPPYNYYWNTSPPQTTVTATGLLPGAYNFCVTDIDGCSLCDTALISFGNCSALFTLTADTTILHHYIAMDFSSGVAPLQYVWDWGDGTQDTIAYPSHTYATAGTYTICLTITDFTGCTNTFCNYSYLQKSTNTIVSVDVIPGVITGIISNGFSDQLNIYPNPASNNLIIESTPKSTIEILSIQSQLIKTFTSNETKTNVDVSALPAGVYMVQVKTEKGVGVRKFVKE